MRNFFKIFTASCLGTIGALIILIFIIVVFGLWRGKQLPSIKKNAILQIEFKGPIPEMTDNIAESSTFSFQQNNALGLRDIKQLIHKASSDNNIAGIVINGGSSGIPPATALSIRNSLSDFRKAGKFVYAYDEYYSQLGYFLSSTADSIFLNPNGSVEFKGFAVSIPHFKELMDDLGVDMNVFYAGDFKSATEPYRRKDMSEQNKIQTRSYLNSILDAYLQEIAKSRNLETDHLFDLMDELKIQNGKDALTHGLVDSLSYKSQFLDFLTTKLNIEKRKDINFIKLAEYAASLEAKEEKTFHKNKIAILYAEGDILFEDDSKGVISENRYEKVCDQILEDEDIKAVVLRVNSPGGSSLTSDIIWQRIEELKAHNKFVIASYGDYAASGGYYISCGADSIIAQKNTLTGSIGVYSMFPKIKNLVSDKLGIHFDTVKTTNYAIVGSPYFDLNETEKKVFERSTNKIYDKFLSRVAAGRNMSKDEAHVVAQGRIWSGTQASMNGLIDGIGDLDKAIDIAANRLNLDAYQIVEYPIVERTFFDELLGNVMPSAGINYFTNPIQEIIPDELQAKIVFLKKWASTKEPLARLPFTLEY